ncbi:MAG: hypothetical protein ACJAY5_000951 [Actinomycetes bacterium]|jgi:hypothetical protein
MSHEPKNGEREQGESQDERRHDEDIKHHPHEAEERGDEE